MTASILRKLMILATVGVLAGCTLPFGGSSSGSNNNNGGSSANASPKGPGIAADITLGKEFWYGGFHVTIGEVTYKPEVKITPGSDVVKDDAELLIQAKFENLSKDTRGLYAEMTVASNNQQYTHHNNDQKIPQVPGKSTSNGTIAWVADDKFNLDDAILTVGDANTNQAVVPLGSKGSLVSLAPRILSITGAITLPSDFTLNVTGGALTYDIPENADQLDTGVELLTLFYSITGTGTHGCCVGTDSFSLKVPDGTAVASTKVDPTSIIPGKGITKQDQRVEFQIKEPVEGSYDMVVQGSDEGVNADLQFTITAGGSSSGGSTTTSPAPSGSGSSGH
ncbi:MAG: hypothetical protein QOE92_1324 [Chloroflexota bacterium]|nr:hypothetical protein [Chloroflexota bacterium]